MISRRLAQRFAVTLGPLAISLGLSPTAANASPISINLRVEGSSTTLFERPIRTEAIPNPPGVATKSSGGSHPCDVKDNGINEGFGASGPTPTAALFNAALANGLAFDASWSAGALNDFFITRVGPDANGGPPEFPSWGYAVNYTTAGVGGCQFRLAPGSEVLWAYNYFNLQHLLLLSGTSSVDAETPFTLHVSDGQTGEPIYGASIGQVLNGVTTSIGASPVTDAMGNVAITIPHTGAVTLKATRGDSVRSNGLAVCVHNGSDGTCGTLATSGGGSTSSSSSSLTTRLTPVDVARVHGVKNGHVYRRRFAPRVLGGIVEVPAGGTLRDVRIRLERRYQGRCFDFSGAREAFRRARKCAAASFFSVGDSESFTYLLPSRLAVGRYVYDLEAVDSSGATTKLVPGVSHVVFRVR
jgi:hypothetical protein